MKNIIEIDSDIIILSEINHIGIVTRNNSFIVDMKGSKAIEIKYNYYCDAVNSRSRLLKALCAIHSPVWQALPKKTDEVKK